MALGCAAIESLSAPGALAAESARPQAAASWPAPPSTTASGAAFAPPTYALSWVRAEGAEECPNGHALASEVERRLGRAVFDVAAERSLEVEVTRFGAISCSALEQSATADAGCAPSDADQAACQGASVGDPGSSDSSGVAPTVSNGGGGPTGTSTGGAAMTDPPPNVAGVPMAAPISCMGAWGTAGASSGGPPPASAVVCEEGLGGCSDGHEYSWLCAKGSQGETACSCLIDSQVTGGFDPGGPSCPTQLQVNAGCKWNITQ